MKTGRSRDVVQGAPINIFGNYRNFLMNAFDTIMVGNFDSNTGYLLCRTYCIFNICGVSQSGYCLMLTLNGFRLLRTSSTVSPKDDRPTGNTVVFEFLAKYVNRLYVPWKEYLRGERCC